MYVDVNNTRLWFDVDGPSLVPDGTSMRERPTVVLLHGGPGYDHSYFKPDFGRLAKLAQVIYIDHRGLGRSDAADPSRWNFELLADDVRGFCDALGITNPIMYGHSMGGFVAMLYAARHPDHPLALVLQSTTARFDLPRVVEGFRRAGGDDVAEIARRFYDGDPSVTADEWSRCRVLFGSWAPGEVERARIILHPELGKSGLALIRALDIVDKLSQIKCSTLVSVGDRDPVMQIEDARQIVSSIPKGIAQLHVLEGAGHFPWKDAPDRYWPMFEEFVRTMAKPLRVDTILREPHRYCLDKGELGEP